jgi:hypothetical protein
VVSSDGQWPLFIPLYGGGGGGQALGWLLFINTGDADVVGLVNWIKQPDAKAKLYPGGFEVETNATGSLLDSALTPVTGFSNAAVVLSGGNLTASFTNFVSISARNKVTNLSTNKLSLTLNASQGQFKGSAVDPATGKTIKFSGVILQKRDVGTGFSPGTNQSGSVIIGN